MASAGIPTIAEIQQATSREYGVPFEKMREPRTTIKAGGNNWKFSRPRQVAMALSVRLTSHSYPRIGHFFGNRNHATVRYANRAVASRCRKDAALHATMRRLTFELINRTP